MQQHSRPTRKRGFTLVELIVVIAIIVMLAAILVPAINYLVGGKSLQMARNTIDGYLGTLRMEAVNRNTPVLVVYFPDPYGEYTFKAPDANGNPVNVTKGGGFVPFFLHNDGDEDNVVERMEWMGEKKTLIFNDKFDDGIETHPRKVRDFGQMNLPPELLDRRLVDQVVVSAKNEQNEKKPYYMFLIQADGRGVIPADIPGYLVDKKEPNTADGDIVLTDGVATCFLDISTQMRVREALYQNTELSGNARYGKRD